MSPANQTAQIVARLRDLLGPSGLLTLPSDLVPYEGDNAFKSIGGVVCVARPEDTALSFDGTVSEEHGIGQSKCEALKRMKSVDEIRLMAAIKEAFDPHRTLNPSKVIQ